MKFLQKQMNTLIYLHQQFILMPVTVITSILGFFASANISSAALLTRRKRGHEKCKIVVDFYKIISKLIFS